MRYGPERLQGGMARAQHSVVFSVTRTKYVDLSDASPRVAYASSGGKGDADDFCGRPATSSIFETPRARFHNGPLRNVVNRTETPIS